MDIRTIEEALAKVSDVYASRFEINRDRDWYILKIQEEVGELVSSYLKLTQRGRSENGDKANLEKNMREELADVIAMAILFARNEKIDVEQAIREKWFKYL